MDDSFQPQLAAFCSSFRASILRGPSDRLHFRAGGGALSRENGRGRGEGVTAPSHSRFISIRVINKKCGANTARVAAARLEPVHLLTVRANSLK